MKVIHDLTLSSKLKIVQREDRNAYTFDSLLLASFTNATKHTYEMVDLCSGNAPIGLLMSTKKSNLNIKCVEIQKDVSKLAQESVELNKLENRIEIISDDLIGISKKIGENKYDLVTCNPPYFRVDDTSNLSDNDYIAIARHEIAVTLEDVILESKKLLNNEGKLTLIHRPDRIDEIIYLLTINGFSLKRIKFVYPYVGKNANIVLIEATKKKQINNKIHVEEPLYVYNKNKEYTEDAKKIMEF